MLLSGTDMQFNLKFGQHRLGGARSSDAWKDKLSSNAFVRKLLSSPIVLEPLHFQYDKRDPNSTYNWLERWTLGCIWKSVSQPKRVPDGKLLRFADKLSFISQGLLKLSVDISMKFRMLLANLDRRCQDIGQQMCPPKSEITQDSTHILRKVTRELGSTMCQFLSMMTWSLYSPANMLLESLVCCKHLLIVHQDMMMMISLAVEGQLKNKWMGTLILLSTMTPILFQILIVLPLLVLSASLKIRRTRVNEPSEIIPWFKNSLVP